LGDAAENTEVIPLNSFQGCLLAKSGKTIKRVLIGVPNSMSDCEDVDIRNMHFARPFGNHSLIVLESCSEKKWDFKNQRASKFMEYKIDMKGRKSLLKPPKEICTLQTVATNTSTFEFSSSQQNLMAILCHIDGKVEVITFPTGVT